MSLELPAMPPINIKDPQVDVFPRRNEFFFHPYGVGVPPAFLANGIHKVGK